MRNGFTEDMLVRVQEWRELEGLRQEERHAIDYAERFCSDHLSIDDEFIARLRDTLTDGEIVDLTVFIGSHLAFGRLAKVLGTDHVCAIVYPPRGTQAETV